jgi:hypothetical protein
MTMRSPALRPLRRGLDQADLRDDRIRRPCHLTGQIFDVRGGDREALPLPAVTDRLDCGPECHEARLTGDACEEAGRLVGHSLTRVRRAGNPRARLHLHQPVLEDPHGRRDRAGLVMRLLVTQTLHRIAAHRRASSGVPVRGRTGQMADVAPSGVREQVELRHR